MSTEANQWLVGCIVEHGGAVILLEPLPAIGAIRVASGPTP